MKDDYGYFGKGTTGYVHYMESFNRNNGGGKQPGGGRSGCLSTLVVLAVVVLCMHLI